MNELPKPPVSMSRSNDKMQRKMQALRLSKSMTDLHDEAHDRGKPEEEGRQAAAALGMIVLKHFDLIVWALRVAGGARNP